MSFLVKMNDLKKSLLNEKSQFASWDNGRRNKVEIVIKAINKNKDYANLSDLQKTVTEITSTSTDLQELQESAIKMLRIHYLKLGRTPEEQTEYLKRRQNALEKIKNYEKEHTISI